MSNVSISGPRSRSRCTISAPNARSPRIAASIVTNARPRNGSGISGIGGICMIRAAEVTSSGTVAVHSRQAWSTSEERSHGQNIAPA